MPVAPGEDSRGKWSTSTPNGSDGLNGFRFERAIPFGNSRLNCELSLSELAFERAAEEHCELFGSWRAKEQNRAQAGPSERFQCISRAGEIVPVIREQ